MAYLDMWWGEHPAECTYRQRISLAISYYKKTYGRLPGAVLTSVGGVEDARVKMVRNVPVLEGKHRWAGHFLLVGNLDAPALWKSAHREFQYREWLEWAVRRHEDTRGELPTALLIRSEDIQDRELTAVYGIPVIASERPPVGCFLLVNE